MPGPAFNFRALPTVPLLAGFGAVWLTGAALTLLLLHSTDWRGDEYTYTAAARTIGAWIAGRGGSLETVFNAAAGRGWFMPGTSLIASAPYIVTETPPIWIVRGWMGLVNIVLSVFAAREFAVIFGRRSLIVPLVFPALVPLWHVAALSVLGEVPAALLLAIALGRSWRIATSLDSGNKPSWRSLAMLAALLAAAIYLRGPMALPAVVLPALLVAIALVRPDRSWRTAIRIAAVPALVALAVTPWSWAMSARYGEFVATTTNVPLVIADSFGDPANNCLGPCPPGPDILPAWEAAQAAAAETGRSPLEVEREIRDRALSGLTLRGYFVRVREHFSTYLADPGGSLRAFLPVSYGVPNYLREPALAILTGLSLVLYVPFMAGLLFANFAVFRGSQQARLRSLLLKAVTACIVVQPFVHKSSARYWVALAPLAAWAVVMLANAWVGCRRGQPAAPNLPLDALQAAWAAVVVIVAAALALA